jgi:O-antigen/teichoic acid export membrane protein
VFLLAGPLSGLLHAQSAAYRAAGVAIVFVAVAQVYLGGSRGLKIMSHTLYAYWIGQSISWIVLTLAGWAIFSKSVPVTVGAYAGSWVFATAIAAFFWFRTTRPMGSDPAESNELHELVAYGAPRAPAALLSQALFYTDLFVLSAKLPSGDPPLSVYAASVRVAQALVLFLTAVSYMFSPFAADLHERGERQRLDDLFKSITRWTIAGTVPLLLLFAIAPDHVLEVFGAQYHIGAAWLRTLLIGQVVNVSVGAAGFVLIMVRRTGWDLIVYASSFVVDLGASLVLIPHLGPEGAAIAQASTLVFSNVFRLLLVRRFVGIWPYDRSYARLAIPTAIGAVAMILIHSVLNGPKWGVDLLGTGFFGGLAYYAALLVLGLKPEERAAVVSSARRLIA